VAQGQDVPWARAKTAWLFIPLFGRDGSAGRSESRRRERPGAVRPSGSAGGSSRRQPDFSSRVILAKQQVESHGKPCFCPKCRDARKTLKDASIHC